MTVVDVTDTQRDYLQAIVSHDDPVVTANEIADARDVTQQAANKELNKLADVGLVDKKKVGSRAVVWWLTPQGRNLL